MSITFAITPYEPSSWATVVSDLRLDIDTFKSALLTRWRSAKCQAVPEGGLLWEIPENDGGVFWGILHSDHQVVTFKPGNWTEYREFILWYRQQVPELYPLYFFNTISRKSLLVTSQTTIDDIEGFKA
jgi:hypothetical protein